MKNILILGAKGDLAKSIIKNIDKTKSKIYKLEKKEINFNKLNSKKKLFSFLKQINPDVVINSIGFFDTNKGDFDVIIKSNLYPTWLLIEYFMKNKQIKAKVICIGSSSYNKPRKNYILYAATKTALNNMMASAKELFKGSKIYFHAINPPAMKSRMRSKVLRLLKLKQKKKLENLDNVAKKITKKFKL